MPTSKNQGQQNMQNPGGGKDELERGETVAATGAYGKDECCERIIEQLNRGVAVTLLPQGTDATGEEFEELNCLGNFIQELSIDFDRYKQAMDDILNSIPGRDDPVEFSNRMPGAADRCTPLIREVPLDPFEKNVLPPGSPLFTTTYAYQLLKYATEKYLRFNFGYEDFAHFPGGTLPYLKLVESKLEGYKPSAAARSSLYVPFRPIFLELIWCYWHEEGLVVQTINAIARRFQNIRSGYRDPLANMEISPLRPLNNILWGYVQDYINRLTPERMCNEYYHEYGICPAATTRALPPADNRSYFIQSFHNLLTKCSQFYREADNLIRVADALPVLNAIREVHMILSEGAHNQFGDLPLMARSQMLLEQYILARPEIREFLGGRPMVTNDPSFLDIVDSMKALQGWNRTSTLYFTDLATFGEKILLSIRWIAWTKVNNRNVARAWALLFRDAIQRYIDCYQAVTGVDLSAVNVTASANQRSLMPAVLIRRKTQRDLMMRRR